MIRTRFIGRLGNNLFQYCIGKILAELTGQQYTPPRYFIDKRGRPIVKDKSNLFSLTPTDGLVISGHQQELYFTHWYDLSTVDKATPIHLQHAYAQRYELYRDYNRKIRDEWLPLQLPFIDVPDDTVVLHCRRDDYVNANPDIQGLAATIEDYAKCVAEFPDAKRLVVVTDDTKDPWLYEFHKLGIPWTVESGNLDQDFMLLASCKNLVISQSTFSWWAGFLGKAEKIVCPMFQGSFWRHGVGLYGPANPDYPNLYVDDEPERWIWKLE